jgi:isopentenyl phosphate kinase
VNGTNRVIGVYGSGVFGLYIAAEHKSSDQNKAKHRHSAFSVKGGLEESSTSSIDLTDKITSYGEEYSIAIRALGTTDNATFFSKEKQLIDNGRGFAPQMSVWPNISFK